MNGFILLVIAVVVLGLGYKVYGDWLCKKWGIDDKNETPAHRLADGIDYVAAPAPVLMGHHFSSIAGAGPITGPIAAVSLGFGWLACTLWILIGGIFFGGVHDFGALVASIRHDGKSIGEIISANMSLRAKRLFIIFAYLTLILVVAAFAAIVAATFAAKFDANGNVIMAQSVSQARVAMVSLLFIAIAMVFGFCVYRRNASMAGSTILGVIAIVAIIAIGDTVRLALEAAEELKKEGIGARVLDMHTLKPLDKDAVNACINDIGRIVTVEDHNILNGLGSAGCECVAEAGKGKVVRIGVQDRFGHSAPYERLLAENGITVENIVAQAKGLMK